LAFSSKKHRNLAERKAEERQKEVEKKAKEEAKCTAKELSTKTEKNIIDGDIVFAWKENDRQFFLHFEGKNFVLNEKNSNEKLLNKRYFETFELFWEFFSENKTWFLQRFFLPLPEPEKRFLAVFYVISSLREAKKMLILPSKEAYALYSWEQHFQSEELKKTEFVQFCPECKAEVFYFPRYPNYLCSACTALLTDKKGKKVAFYNEGMYGGCIGFYLDNEGNTSNKYEKDSAFIGEKEFYAQEGRFGGIVIQPVFKNDTPVFRR
jgi:hypothetical protein